MRENMKTRRITLQILSVLAFSFLIVVHGIKVFNVLHYKAVADNKTDNSKAFIRAWVDTCQWNGKSRLAIPRGTYYLSSVVLQGPCNGRTEVLIRGVLRAPTHPALFMQNHWISFERVNKLKIHGGGTFDGQGAIAWPYNNCDTGSCRHLPISLRLDFINDTEVSNINFINSKNFHFNLYSCHRIHISNVTVSAPEDSPNTDGIHVSNSAHIFINQAVIATGASNLPEAAWTSVISITPVPCSSVAKGS